ncbi:MAG: mechanosensitive ion channel family protein [bacterium]|nr:MAG: mechanosensitive ion channel family protein [bacterium]
MDKFFTSVFSRLQSEFDLETLGSRLAAFIANLIVGIFIFFVFYCTWWLLNRIIRSLLKYTKTDKTTASFIETALKFIILTIGLVQALSAVGINTAALLTSLGIAGLTIGFAARDALSNLISGLLIFWDRPFVIGDIVEVEGHYGRVEKITLRSTRVVTVDGRMLAVPNTTIINSTVASYTNFPHLRLNITVSVSVNEDIDRARNFILDLVTNDQSFMKDPKPQVVVTALNDYNVELQLQIWLKDERQHIAKTFELREKVYKTLTEHGVEMPFETFQITPIEIKK